MKVTLVYHALLREKTGLNEEVLDLPEGAALSRALFLLREKYPGLETLWPAVKFAVNEDFAGTTTVLRDGDRIDVLPPFGGG